MLDVWRKGDAPTRLRRARCAGQADMAMLDWEARVTPRRLAKWADMYLAAGGGSLASSDAIA